MRRHHPFSRRGEQAIRAAQEAALADAMPRCEVGDDLVYTRPGSVGEGPSGGVPRTHGPRHRERGRGGDMGEQSRRSIPRRPCADR